MSDFFENKSIYLRALEPEDIDTLYKWENRTDYWRQGATMQPFSRYAIRQYVIDAVGGIFETKQLRMMIIDKQNEEKVGTIDLYDFDIHHKRAGIGILIYPPFQRKGYATEAIECMERYAFKHLKMNQIFAYISIENQPSIALFNKAGFTNTATLKKWISLESGYFDVFLMQKINPIEQK